jgi:hypothetical protein
MLDEAALLEAFAAAGLRHEVVRCWPCEPGARRAVFALTLDRGAPA